MPDDFEGLHNSTTEDELTGRARAAQSNRHSAVVQEVMSRIGRVIALMSIVTAGSMATMTNLVTAIATVLALVAAAIAAGISLRQTRLLAQENEVARSVARFELFRSMESSYIEIYPRIIEELGPWDDVIEVDGGLRRCVHDLAAQLSCVYNAQSLGSVATD